MTSRRIVFAVFPGFQLLDLAGPNEVFVQAGRLVAGAAGAAGQGVVVDTVAAAPGPVASSGGITVTPTLTAGEVTGPVDTLVAVGGRGVHQACQDAGFVQRPGGQAQFSAQLAARRPEGQPLRDVLDWVADHLAEISVFRRSRPRPG